jgi:hypothetical protein
MKSKRNPWLNAVNHLIVSNSLSLITAVLSFQAADMDLQTQVTFLAFYLILGGLTAMFMLRHKLTNPGTRQLLQMSYFLLGFVLMLIGLLGLFNKPFGLQIAFLFMLFLPGLTLFRAGLLFNKE